jgi:hypothetical protein
VVYRDLLATTSVVDLGRVQPTAENVLLHEAVVEAMARTGPTLPVRFGTIFSDVGALERALRDRYDTLVADLGRVGDKVEMGLTVLADGADHPDTPNEATELDADGASANGGPGTRYMRARLAVHRRDASRRKRAIALEDSAAQELSAHIIERRSVVAPSPRLLLRAAYLLDPSSVPPFLRAIEKLRAAHDDVRVLVSGPWPPYSFVSRAGDGAEAADVGRDPVSGGSR